MNTPNFTGVLADISAQQDIEAQAAFAHETGMANMVWFAKCGAAQFYRELAEVIEFGPLPVFEDDAMVLLGALRTLFVKDSLGMSGDRRIAAVECIEEGLLTLAPAEL